MCITYEQKGKNAFKSGKQKWGNMNQSSGRGEKTYLVSFQTNGRVSNVETSIQTYE
jgi:hypothetical protein